MNSTQRPQRLLKNNGTIATEIVKSVIVPDHMIVPTALSFGLGTKVFSLRPFISANAVRANNSVDDIDHCTANNSTNCAVQSTSVPVPFAAMGAFVFVRDNEVHVRPGEEPRQVAVIYIEGANHGFTGCTPCEKTPDEYQNSFRNWEHFMIGGALGKRRPAAHRTSRRAPASAPS